MSDIKAEKSKLRKSSLERRNALSSDEREKIDADIFSRLITLPEYIAADTVFTYVSTGSEADTHRIITYSLSKNKAVAVPKCVDDRIIKFYYINSLDDLSPGAYGISEPREGAEPAENLSGICLVPALLYDYDGYRIGYGKGYYDRFLPQFDGVTVGLCAHEFFVNILPRYGTDCPVDMIITNDDIHFTDDSIDY
ncbi:MAG: 5-formyltetrahydrofolate cyclo-ligase [Acutalibacteraceae bacterium]